ncbi:MAG TPA: hypothetical protein VE439_00775 [Anaerolineae bacterium]|jgi:hypothetical protein|nr:hypothetical protein [Anaerolineae bacterium]
MKRFAISLAVIVTLILGLTAPAYAATGYDFGQHHSTHAREMSGFTKDMNPGMHRGYAGWDDCQHTH